MSTLKRMFLTGGALVIGASALIPSIGMAVSGGIDSQPVSLNAAGNIGSFTPASVDPKLAADLSFSALNKRQNFRFTPATDANNAAPRAVTVAVRVNTETAKAVNIRPKLAIDKLAGKGSTATPVRITKTAYSLGVAKGWQKFALPNEVRNIDMPDLGAIRSPVKSKTNGKPSRFRPNVELDATSRPGSTPRTFDGEAGYTVDVGGKYKLTRNLDVTAGVRIRNERDRLAPLTDEQKDSQAVYVGTQFRF
ncbi:hypothetical protein [Sphingorhabdus sp. Alg239-R122]|uniref:hypothetical protein n=1 Tax=Sphingorhabdus sp. Alg239-R122 TaxID=2305989 RepID=UPI0013DA91C5|nr:hypothetical protein [Sphingorhabdus sp. Alg239-R122]